MAAAAMRVAVRPGSQAREAAGRPSGPLVAHPAHHRRHAPCPPHQRAFPGLAGALPAPWLPARPDVLTRSAALTADDSGYQFQLRLPFPLRLPAGTAAALATAATVATVMAAGIANRVLYRMALVPMQDYVFFLAQFQTFGYVMVYFALLQMRCRAGKVTPDMLQGLPKGKFMLVGACEAAAQVLLMVGAAQLPGAVLPLVSQSALLWNMLLSALLLHIRVRFEQVAGALLVIGGVAMAAWPSGGACLLHTDQLAAVGMCCLSFLFPSLGASVKERIFVDAHKRLGRPLDLFVVNSFGSASQAIFVAALLPFLTTMRGMPLAALPDYLGAGSRCFLGLTPACGGDCTGAPLLPTLYVATNLIFNISALNLLRSQGTVALSLCMAGLVPLTIWAFSLPLPYLDPAVLGPMFCAGTLVLMLGLLVFNFSHWRPHLERLIPIPHQS